MYAVSSSPERNRYGFRRCLTEVVAALPISQYVADTGITELQPSGIHLVGLCPFHSERTPSFTVFGDSSFYCFGCSEWGDVVSLHAKLNGYERQWVALVELAQRYDIELPERPKSWHDWQGQKAEIHAFNERIRHRRRLRRWFRIYHRDDLAAIADPEERRIETEKCWRELESWMPHWRWTST